MESALKEIYNGQPGPVARSLLGHQKFLGKVEDRPSDLPCLVKIKEEEETFFEEEHDEKTGVVMEEDDEDYGDFGHGDEEYEADVNGNTTDTG